MLCAGFFCFYFLPAIRLSSLTLSCAACWSTNTRRFSKFLMKKIKYINQNCRITTNDKTVPSRTFSITVSCRFFFSIDETCQKLLIHLIDYLKKQLSQCFMARSFVGKNIMNIILSVLLNIKEKNAFIEWIMALEKRYGNRMLWIFTTSPSGCPLDMSTPTCRGAIMQN